MDGLAGGVLVGIGAFVIGIIGFLQIVGSAKKANSLTGKGIAWIVALIAIWLIASYLFELAQMIVFYVGYQIAFVLSFVFTKE